jgi:hypothetical protein
MAVPSDEPERGTSLEPASGGRVNKVHAAFAA